MPRSARKTRKPAKEYRLTTKYQKEDFVKLTDEERKENKTKAYPCPICTYYYNRRYASIQVSWGAASAQIVSVITVFRCTIIGMFRKMPG